MAFPGVKIDENILLEVKEVFLHYTELRDEIYDYLKVVKVVMIKDDNDPSTLDVEVECMEPKARQISRRFAEEAQKRNVWPAMLRFTDHTKFNKSQPKLPRTLLGAVVNVEISLLTRCHLFECTIFDPNSETMCSIHGLMCPSEAALDWHTVWIRDVLQELPKLESLKVDLYTNFYRADKRSWPESHHGPGFASKAKEVVKTLPKLSQLVVWRYDAKWKDDGTFLDVVREIDTELKADAQSWAMWREGEGWSDNLGSAAI